MSATVLADRSVPMMAMPGRDSAKARVSAANRSSGRCIAVAIGARSPNRPVASAMFVDPLCA